MKIAFVTHDVSVYGASRSLRGLILELNKQQDIHIIVSKPYRHHLNIDNISDWFKIDKKKIHDFYIPFSYCFLGKINLSKKMRIIRWIKRIKWIFLDKMLFHKFLVKESFDIIHLNSIALHEILNHRFNMILHVREIFDGETISVIENISKAKGVIFIDLATKERFMNLNSSIVLNNPFDMTVLNKFSNKDYNLSFRHNIDWKSKIIFSMIGRLEDIKGVLFVINVFKQYVNANALLLIVGATDNNEKTYLQKCEKAIGNDSRIIIYGEEKEIEKIYYISDYLVRGEPFACIGRTIYEALYAGLEVIVPGDAIHDNKIFFNYNQFANRIHFYVPRDTLVLIQILNECNKKPHKKRYMSNTEHYSETYMNFITFILSGRYKCLMAE